jgi:hypothetical protein
MRQAHSRSASTTFGYRDHPKRRSMAARSGTVLGSATAIALHSLWVIPQLVQRNRIRSPIVCGDQRSESIDDSVKKPSQTGHGRLS